MIKIITVLSIVALSVSLGVINGDLKRTEEALKEQQRFNQIILDVLQEHRGVLLDVIERLGRNYT